MIFYDLTRFLEAQDGIYPIVLKELQEGRKHSSMTLFDIVSPNDVFARVLDKYFDGKRDNRTINIIKSQNESI